MTFGKLCASRGGRFPWVKSTYRLRSRRSSEFAVINYGVDDRVPPLFLLSSSSTFRRSLFLLILLLLYLAPVRARSPTLSHQCRALLLFLLPPETLAPFFLFFLYTPNCLAEAVCCVSGQRSNHVWSPFIKLSIPDTCTARARRNPRWNGRARVASTIFRRPILNSDPKPESDLKERC